MKTLHTRFAHLISTIAVTALFLIAGSSQAGVVNFNGNLNAHNEVVSIAFTLNQGMSDFRLWTDSFHNGANFNPVMTLWQAGSGNFFAESDDDPYIKPGQTYGDAGFFFSWLGAGDYILTLIASPNFALGSNLADGFVFDAETPMPLDTGGYWRFWMTTAQGGVSEPALLALLMIGALGASVTRIGQLRRRQTACPA